MAAPKGNKFAGSRKGKPNKATKDVREAIATFAEANVERMAGWLTRIEKNDPAKAMDLYLRAIEYHIPKLGRTEHTGKDGKDMPLGVIMIPAKEPRGA